VGSATAWGAGLGLLLQPASKNIATKTINDIEIDFFIIKVLLD
jgi:hypothetical protein